MNQPTPTAVQGGETTTGASTNRQGSISNNSNPLTQPGEPTTITLRHGPSSNNSNFLPQPTLVSSFDADPSDHFEAMVASLHLSWCMQRAWKCPG